jgi:hypothetical protein
MNAYKDMLAGYNRGRSYLCRHCELRIVIHNGQWEHVREPPMDFGGVWCSTWKSMTEMDQAQPVPFGTAQIFDEKKV